MSRLLRATTIATFVLMTAFVAAQSAPQPQTDEYVRYDLSTPSSSTFRVTYEVSATSTGATTYIDPVKVGTTVTQVVATDVMSGQPLKVAQSVSALTITLARSVPKNGQGRIRIEKTVKDAKGFALAAGTGVFTQVLSSRRGSLVLPPGFALVGCNMPSQVLSETDGRVGIAFMNQAPGTATLVVRVRAGAQTGPAAAPKALTNTRSWEPPPAQGPTERTRLGERARQDRDITYFLQDPSTNAFSLFHDYTETRPGTDKYINVVRTGSRVSNPSAYILDTGEVLRHETLKGQAITDAKIDIGSPVLPETEIVVSYFPPVQAGKSVRLRISETYTAPQSYRLEGDDLVFDRSLGRPRNSVVLPAGWYITALSIPGVISETPEGLLRVDFYNGRNDSLDVLIKARKKLS